MRFTDAAALIRPEELARMLDSATPAVVLDVRWRLNSPSMHRAYLDSHVPGARWCDLETDLADPPGVGGRHPLPDPGRLQRRIVDWGIGPDSTVVAYDLDDSVAAARAWWVLRWVGVTDVRVLDGGWAAWQSFGGMVTDEVPATGGGTAMVRPGAIPSLTAAQAARMAREATLIDVRAPERFRGEVERIDPVAGHIPGAVNLPTLQNVSDTGEFRPLEELADRYGAVPEGSAVGVYCGSGVTAAHTVLALHELGIDALLYPGSWSEWITDPYRPVAVGD